MCSLALDFFCSTQCCFIHATAWNSSSFALLPCMTIKYPMQMDTFFLPVPSYYEKGCSGHAWTALARNGTHLCWTARSSSMCIVSFSRYCWTIFQVDCTSLHSQWQGMRVPVDLSTSSKVWLVLNFYQVMHVYGIKKKQSHKTCIAKEQSPTLPWSPAPWSQTFSILLAPLSSIYLCVSTHMFLILNYFNDSLLIFLL